MSIQLAAKHLAAHGRGPDTTLVHMTPGEVASLQSLAQQHGGSLSINPDTGLPEAGFLSALLPMAAGAGLAAMGMPAGYAALSVGAASALTNGGDLKKGLMNGISAYGGAGMAESFMGAGLGAMSAPTAGAVPTTVLETAPGATSPYALTGSTTAPSTTGYSLGESSSFLNKPLPTLASAAPAEVAKQAAAATPAAQAAQQAAALDSMSMGQRFDALKAGATGTNAMNYIKANPFTSLGVATAAMTPDETSTPQKTADTDRGPRSKLQYYSGYGTSLPKPNMQGIEQTYNRPYYAAEGGVAHMAEGGIASAPRNQQQLFADYLARVSGATGAGAGVEVAPVTEPEVEVVPETPKVDLPFLETPVASNTRGGGDGYGNSPEARAERAAYFDNMSPEQREAHANSLRAGVNFVTSLTPGAFIPKAADYAQGFIADRMHSNVMAQEAEKNEADRVKAESDNLLGMISYTNEITPYSAPLGDPAQQQQAQARAIQAANAEAAKTYSPPQDPAQRAAEAQASREASAQASLAPGAGSGGGGGNRDGGIGGSNPGDPGRGGGGAHLAQGGLSSMANRYDLGSYSDGGRLLKGPGDGVSDSIPATIGKGRPARLADGEFVIPARIVSEIGNGSTEAGARKLYAMMDRIQAGRKKSVGKGKVAVNSRADKHLPA